MTETIETRLKKFVVDGCPNCGASGKVKVYSREAVHQYVSLDPKGELDWGISNLIGGDSPDETVFAIQCPECDAVWEIAPGEDLE